MDGGYEKVGLLAHTAAKRGTSLAAEEAAQVKAR